MLLSDRGGARTVEEKYVSKIWEVDCARWQTEAGRSCSLEKEDQVMVQTSICS
jgi:hypothetical protein